LRDSESSLFIERWLQAVSECFLRNLLDRR